MPGIAMIPKAYRQPRDSAITPPRMTPIAVPIGMAAVKSPFIVERFSSGKYAAIIACPPEVYAASPTPTMDRRLKRLRNPFAKAQAPEAIPHRIPMMLIAFFRLQRSTRSETGNTNIVIINVTMEEKEPNCLSFRPHSVWRYGMIALITMRSI